MAANNPLQPTEHEIQNAILDYLRRIKLKPWRNNTGAFPIGTGENRRYIRMGQKGLPDVMCVLDGGKFMAIEIKKHKGRPTPEQTEWLQYFKELGALAFVAFSVDDVIKQINNHYGAN